jgi:SAM-dependent methyltransferase
LSPRLAILAPERRSDYGGRLARLRWKRAVGAAALVEWRREAPAAEALSGAEVWVAVTDLNSLPVVRGPLAEPAAGRPVVAGTASPDGAFVHSLRELEAVPVAAGPAGAEPAAVLFRASDFPARPSETVAAFVARTLEAGRAGPVDPGFLALTLDESSERERPELTRRLPPGRRRILDAGCGAGSAVAAAKSREPGWHVTGIEWDPELAAAARRQCDRVVEGDLLEALPALAADGERFDAIVFADVLEHLEDPAAALGAARRLADPRARLLVSVPNVGHLSIVRDLVCGRFDPIPAGLADVRHLRWFTRAFLADTLAEAGWRDVRIEGEPGAPPPDPGAFLELAAGWPEGDRESLSTYQWIATAAA